MAFIKLQFRPGVNRDNTDYANEGGWYECDKARFRSGFPEKLGGWTSTPLVGQFIGVCRQMWVWRSSYSDVLLALGTNVKVYIENNHNLYDVTPLRSNTPTIGPGAATTGAVSTTAGSNVVTFTLTVPHLAETGDYVVISGVTSGTTIGGIPAAEINGNHVIGVVPDIYTFTFKVPTVATSSVSGAGGADITLDFEIRPGNANATAGYGWGTGSWGHDTWGSSSVSGVYLQQRDWWFDNFDNDLVMNIRNGPGFWWERGNIVTPDVALGIKAIPFPTYASNWATAWEADPLNPPLSFTPAEYGAGVPTKIMQLLVSQQDKHLIAFGTTPLNINPTTGVIEPADPKDFDPLLIRWADQDTPTDWIPGVLNTAGDIRISRGSRIVRAMPTRQEILVWTDTHLHALQFLGTTDVFGLQEYAENISVMGPRSMITASNVTYWMGKDKFYAYTGRVESLPCTLRDHVFNNLNRNQADQVICGINEEWNEVWWFYPTANADYNDAYVIYQHIDRIWYYGYVPRTAWLDSPMYPHPMACNFSQASERSILYNHEDGIDDDGMPMHSFIQSSDFDLDEGDKFMLMKRIIPDVNFSGSTGVDPTVTMQIKTRRNPGQRQTSFLTDNRPVIEKSVDEYTEQLFIRARARQMAFKIQSDMLGVKWQLGNPRIDVRQDGAR